MADAARMTPGQQSQGLSWLMVACSGAFGRRVAEFLLGATTGGVTTGDATTGGSRVVDAPDIALAFGREAGTGTGAVVAALWRPDPAVCDLADSMAFERGRMWLPVVMDHPVIRIGPVVRPPAGPCFMCSYRRRAQHDTQHAVTAAVHAAYQADPGLGPGGYLPHQARLAAAIAHGMLVAACSGDTADASPPAFRDVVTISLTRHGVTTSPVVPCADCGHCGAAFPRHRSTDLAAWVPGLRTARGRIVEAETPPSWNR